MDTDNRDLRKRARENVSAIEAVWGKESSVLAWIDGYSAGHTDATAAAIKTLGQTPFGPCVVDESAGVREDREDRFGGASCCVCRDEGCEFCPKVDSE